MDKLDQERLSKFKKFNNNIVSKKTDTDDGFWVRRSRKNVNYSAEKIEEIINGGSVDAKRELSIDFFETDGLYRQLILYLATLPKYVGLLIPSVSDEKQLLIEKNQKSYNKALDFIDKISIPELCSRWALKVLSEGAYYGIISSINDGGIIVIDLPAAYCSSNYIDANGNEIIELNLKFFDQFGVDSDLQKTILKSYPKFIQKAYRNYISEKKKGCYKVMIPSDIGICFSFIDDTPLFLNVIPTTRQYKDEVDIEQKRDLEEIKKIIVQKIPHITSTGDLVFEPEEAEEMHKGAVEMMKNNENVSVLTTYADVDAIVSKTSADTASNNLDKMLSNVYAAAGVSGQIFSLAGASSLKYSMDKDLSLMMFLANKFANCFNNLINKEFGNKKLRFKYQFLPVAEHNKTTFIETSLKLATSGYSFLVPSVAMGINQKDLMAIKTLENDVLDLQSKLIPLITSYQTSSENENVGAPKKENEDKAPKTLQNEDSINNQGGVG